MDDVFTSKSPSLCDNDADNDNAFAESAIHVKFLIPSGAAGAVIGKDGLVITDLQRETDTKVKISKQNEFFPGTTERVCLISGSLDGVLKVHSHIANKIFEKREFVNANYNSLNLSMDSGMHGLDDRSRQVKLLIPDSSAGMIIGKGGSYIVHLQRSTNASIKISQRSKEGESMSSTVERCVTIAGDSQSCQRALVAILHKLMEDPQALSSSTYNHLNYFSSSSTDTTTNYGRASEDKMTMPLFPGLIMPSMWSQNMPAIPMPTITRNINHGQTFVPVMNSNTLMPAHSYGTAQGGSVPMTAVSPMAHLLSPGLAPQSLGHTLIWNPNGANNASMRGTPLDTFSSTLAASLSVDMGGNYAVKEVQVPEEYLQLISEIIPILQRECGVGIQMQPDNYQPMNSQLPMKIISLASQNNQKWRVLTIHGSPNSLFRAVDRLQCILQQKDSLFVIPQMIAKSNVAVVSNVPTL